MSNLYPKEIENLPICTHLDKICTLLKESSARSLVLTAETGAGKSTALPLALLKHFSGNILMLEPRRLAVLNIAERVSHLLGEETGETCGYRMHLEKKISSKTRFTVITEAILTRMLQNDPLLEDINVIVIDEFHERSIHADLDLAFLKETMQLRDNLYLIVMSATMDTDKVASFLGADTGTEMVTDVSDSRSDPKSVTVPVYSVPGRTFPVKVLYEPSLSPSKAAVKALEMMEAKNESGSVLVFLPGISDIRRTKLELEEMGTDKDTEILILHSSVPFSEQKKIFKGTDGRRIILSSAIAETSLTVPDVKIVVDSGLCRLNSYNPRAGMQRLITVRESVFNAEQRKGRAGRVQKGICIRLWSQNDARGTENLPEICRSELSTLVLECNQWGVKSFKQLKWLDIPPENAWKTAEELLKLLGCLNEDGITELGKACLSLGTNVRLACVAFSGLSTANLSLSTELAVKYGSDTRLSDKILAEQKKDLERRCQIYAHNSQVINSFPHEISKFSTSYALLCGFPDRIGVLEDEKGTYQFVSGRKAVLKDASAPPKYLVAPEVDAGERIGVIYSYEALEDVFARSFMEKRAQSVVEADFADGKLVKKEKLCYGKLVLKEKNLPVSAEDYMKAVAKKVSELGTEWLPMGADTQNILVRCQFYIQNCPKGDSYGISLGDKLSSLKDTVMEWLGPFVPGGTKVTEENVFCALKYWLDEDSLSKSVPISIQLANGKKRRVNYAVQNETVVPELELIIQQAFGIFESPKIMGVPVKMSLLSPARRPLQITTDLENFWKNTWPEICSEMKGRYPKHNWDYRVAQRD